MSQLPVAACVVCATPTPEVWVNLTRMDLSFTPLASIAVPLSGTCHCPATFLVGLIVPAGGVIVTVGGVLSIVTLKAGLGWPTLPTRSVARTRRLIAPLRPASEKLQVLAPLAGCQAPPLTLTSTNATPAPTSLASPPIT